MISYLLCASNIVDGGHTQICLVLKGTVLAFRDIILACREISKITWHKLAGINRRGSLQMATTSVFVFTSPKLNPIKSFKSSILIYSVNCIIINIYTAKIISAEIICVLII